jgi:DNA-binding beta-propeller fold protein YncE
LVKESKKADDWAQWLPSDIMGNPMPNIGRVRESHNHHQGLGLAKLVSLVKDYSGELWLASGNSMLVIDSNNNKSYQSIAFTWGGVGIACRFDTSLIGRSQKTEEIDEITNALIELLGENDGNGSA